MPKKYKTAIHWFRRDLRLIDNTALNAAARDAETIIPVYLVSSWKKKHRWTGPSRQSFLCGCVSSLAKNLEHAGSRLIVRAGAAESTLADLIEECQAEAVFTNRDPDPFGKYTESKLMKHCDSVGVSFHTSKDTVLHEPDEIATGNGTPYRVYTPFSRNWLSLDKNSPVRGRPKLSAPPPHLASLELPTLETWELPPNTAQHLTPGEKAARKRLSAALDGPIIAYDSHRNSPSGQTTSRLSQDLRFGLLSVREIYARTMEAAQQSRSKTARDSFHTFIKELAWREFYMHILHHFPDVLDHEFNPKYRDLPWEPENDAFQKWSQGRTGFPIVDAGIRELLATGFMHNRVRMIVSMFLTKDLHLDWRLGEGFFMQHLVDGEIASNNGGWQWSAGTGADAAPYFRIQNPWTQSKRYDPDGLYVRQWIPELGDVPAPRFFAPPAHGIPIAPEYPLPIVDHSAERDHTLALFKRHNA
ncbi:MAG: deoxyribodipyrimidine photo-lyase [Verrucomicrobiota bacterium]